MASMDYRQYLCLVGLIHGLVSGSVLVTLVWCLSGLVPLTGLPGLAQQPQQPDEAAANQVDIARLRRQVEERDRAALETKDQLQALTCELEAERTASTTKAKASTFAASDTSLLESQLAESHRECTELKALAREQKVQFIHEKFVAAAALMQEREKVIQMLHDSRAARDDKWETAHASHVAALAAQTAGEPDCTDAIASSSNMSPKFVAAAALLDVRNKLLQTLRDDRAKRETAHASHVAALAPHTSNEQDPTSAIAPLRLSPKFVEAAAQLEANEKKLQLLRDEHALREINATSTSEDIEASILANEKMQAKVFATLDAHRAKIQKLRDQKVALTHEVKLLRDEKAATSDKERTQAADSLKSIEQDRIQAVDSLAANEKKHATAAASLEASQKELQTLRDEKATRECEAPKELETMRTSLAAHAKAVAALAESEKAHAETVTALETSEKDRTKTAEELTTIQKQHETTIAALEASQKEAQTRRDEKTSHDSDASKELETARANLAAALTAQATSEQESTKAAVALAENEKAHADATAALEKELQNLRDEKAASELEAKSIAEKDAHGNLQALEEQKALVETERTQRLAAEATALSHKTDADRYQAELETACTNLAMALAAQNLSAEAARAQAASIAETLASVQTKHEQSIASQVANEQELVKMTAALAANEKNQAQATAANEQRLRDLEKQRDELAQQLKNHVCGVAVFAPAPLPVEEPQIVEEHFVATKQLKTMPNDDDEGRGSIVPAAAAAVVAAVEPVPVLEPVVKQEPKAEPKPKAAVVQPSSSSAPIRRATVVADGPFRYTSQQLIELHAYGTFITQALGNDADLKHLFPLDLAPLDTLIVPVDGSDDDQSGFGLDLLRKLKDGLLLAKLINYVAPRTIDERVLNKRAGGDGGETIGLKWKAIVENLNVCITSAKSLGLTVRIPTDQSVRELDVHSGAVLVDGKRIEITDQTDLAMIPAASPTGPSRLELGAPQLLLLNACSSLENADRIIDLLHQLLKLRLVTSLFGPQKRKADRLVGMLKMPQVDADTKRKLTLATRSLEAPGRGSPAELKRLTLQFTNELISDFDQITELSCLAPEQLLLRWVNWALLQQVADGHVREGAHLVASLSDLDVGSFASLVAQIDAWRVKKGVADQTTLFDVDNATASTLLSYLTSSLSIPHFHASPSIAPEHERLNLLLTAVIFQTWPMLDEPKSAAQSAPATAAATTSSSSSSLPDSTDGAVVAPSSWTSSLVSTSALPSVDGLTDEERESSMLASFLNSSGIPSIAINHLFSDVRSGLVLLRFLDYLSPGCVEWKMAELAPTNKFKCIGNLNLFFKVARERLGLPFVNVGAVDLYSDRNEKFVLAVMWQLLRFHTIARLSQVRTAIGSDAKELTDASILDWANTSVSHRIHPLAQAHSATSVTSFQDPALKNSIWLLNLLDNLQEGCVDWSQVEVPLAPAPAAATTASSGSAVVQGRGASMSIADGSSTSASSLLLRNASYAISVARKLGAELFALPQDIASANRKVIALIVASLMAIETTASAGAASEQQ